MKVSVCACFGMSSRFKTSCSLRSKSVALKNKEVALPSISAFRNHMKK